MKSKLVKFLLVFVVLILLIPYSTTSVPEWKIRIVDEKGNYLPNIEVRQTWSHGQGDSEDNKISDEQGYVTFPARKQYLPLILRIPIRALELLNHYVMPHGSVMGGRAYVWSAKGSNRNWLKYYEGGEITDTFIIGN